MHTVKGNHVPANVHLGALQRPAISVSPFTMVSVATLVELKTSKGTATSVNRVRVLISARDATL